MSPKLVVIACNTASTLVLPHLRERFAIPFVGTVPAIKPAAQTTRSRLHHRAGDPRRRWRGTTPAISSRPMRPAARSISSARAAGAAIAEAELAGDPVSDAEILDELAPCFVEDAGGRTDVVALACTHYPLLLPRFQALAPWPVTWIDPAPAIARRVMQLIGGPVPGHEADEDEALAVFTGGRRLNARLRRALKERWACRGSSVEAMPLAAPERCGAIARSGLAAAFSIDFSAPSP